MLIGIIIGTIVFKGFNINLKDDINVKNSYSVINLFLLPPMILSDIISIYEKNLLMRFTPNLFFGFISSLLGIASTHLGFLIAANYGILDSTEYSWQIMLAMSCFINLSSDWGYRLVKTIPSENELYKVIRERFIINFIIVSGLVYSMRDENSFPTSNVWKIGYKTSIMFIISIAVGIFLGVAFTLIQTRSTSLRKNPMLDMQFIVCFVFTSHFIVQLETDYLADEVPIIFLGLVLAGYSKYNMTPAAVRRFIFILELMSKLAKLLALAMMGLVIPDALSTFSAVFKVFGLYSLFIPITLSVQGLLYLICKFTKIGSLNYSFKQFLLLYFTSISKGPLAFILARKYFHFSESMSDQIDLFTISSLLIFDPLSYFIARYFPKEGEQLQADKVMIHNAEIETSKPKSTWEKALGMINESIISPLLIYDYKNRKDDGCFDDIVRAENMVLDKAEKTAPSMKKHLKGVDEETRITSNTAHVIEKKSKLGTIKPLEVQGHH